MYKRKQLFYRHLLQKVPLPLASYLCQTDSTLTSATLVLIVNWCISKGYDCTWNPTGDVKARPHVQTHHKGQFPPEGTGIKRSRGQTYCSVRLQESSAQRTLALRYFEWTCCVGHINLALTSTVKVITQALSRHQARASLTSAVGTLFCRSVVLYAAASLALAHSSNGGNENGGGKLMWSI